MPSNLPPLLDTSKPFTATMEAGRSPCKETGHARQLEAAVSAALCVVVTGTCFGWVTPNLLTLLGPESPVPMTTSQASWMIALLEFGNLFTPIPAGYLADYYGRKPLILSTGPLYIISWIVIYNAHTIAVLCIARVIQGLALGIVYTVVPMYLGEIPSQNFRGTTTSVFQSAFYFGFLLEYCIGPIVSYKISIAVSAALPLISLICFLRQPETPYYYLMCGREEEAANSLVWLRGKRQPEEVKDELEVMVANVRSEMANRASWRDVIGTPADKRALLIVNVVGAVKILSGSVAVPTYCTQLFRLTGFDAVSPDVITIIMGSVIFTSSFFSTTLTDFTGRKPLLLTSSVGCAFSLFTVGVYFFLREKTELDVEHLNWICPLAIILYCVFLAFGLDPVAMTYRSEMFPANTRAVAASLNSISFTIGSFISLKMYQVVSDTVGVYSVYFGSALVCFLGSLWMYCITIETRGRSLSDIQRELREGAERRKQKAEKRVNVKDMDEGVYRLGCMDTI